VPGHHRNPPARRGEGRPVYDWDEIVKETRGHCVVLTRCSKGAVRTAPDHNNPTTATEALAGLVNAFGREDVAVEITDQGYPLDSQRNDLLPPWPRSSSDVASLVNTSLRSCETPATAEPLDFRFLKSRRQK
jgi:hypothetical protein